MGINAWNLAKLEMKKWIISPRMVLWIPMVVYINHFAIEPIVRAAEDMSAKTGYLCRPNLFEGFIAMGTSGLLLMILPLMLLVLLSDFPNTEYGSVFLIHRISRRDWIIGQILFFVMASIIFIVIIGLISMSLLIGRSEMSFSWSRVVTKYGRVFPDRYGDTFSRLLPKQLYNQMTPLESILHTYLLLLLYSCLIGGILLLSKMVYQKKAGVVAASIIIILGAVFCSFRSDPMWVFPMSHSVVWLHYTEYLREEVLPIHVSYIYMIICNLALYITSYVFGVRYQFRDMEGI